MKNQKVVRLVESALLLALATVLSLIKVLDLPYGGSVTACSMLPILLIAYRHGTVYGLFSGFAYGLIQMLLGFKNVLYFTTPLSIAAVIVLDYVLAFVVLGLGGLFRKKYSQEKALVLGALLTCVLRYLCHVVSGCTVWAGLSIPDNAALVYSLAYNATYMLPETLVTMLGASYLSRAVDLRGERPTRAKADGNARFSVLSLIGQLVAAAALVTDIVLVFSQLQNGETGDFMITGLANVNWIAFAAVTVVGAGLAVVLMLLGRRKKAA